MVDESSACLIGFGQQGLDATHSAMNKFDGPESINFKLVRDQIRSFADTALSAPTRGLSPTPNWDDPAFTKNINFIGRDKEMRSIHDHLAAKGVEKRQGWVSLWGPGGIGKTQLAAAYALKYQRLYSAVFKIRGTSPESIQQDFARLVSKLPLQDCNERDFTPQWPADDADAGTIHRIMQENVRRVHDWFKAHETREDRVWLLVIDDVRLPEVDLRPYIPSTQNGDIIMTTQSKSPGVPWGQVFEIKPLPADDAITLLFDRARKIDHDSPNWDLSRATEICERLGHLPLAVEHAGALIGIKGMQYFWETFRSNPTAILQRPERGSAHQESVFKTFQMSFDVLKARSLPAARLMTFLSFLDNTVISSELFFDEEHMPKRSFSDLRVLNPCTWEDYLAAVAYMHELALVNREEVSDGEIMRVSLQPLVHRMTRTRLTLASNLTYWCKMAAKYHCSPLLQSPPSTIQLSLSNFNHILLVLQQAAELDVPNPPTEMFTQLWYLLAHLLCSFFPRWHIHGKKTELEEHCTRAVAVLERSTDEGYRSILMALLGLLADATSYTNTDETLESVCKTLLAKHLRPAAAMVLERAAARDTSKTQGFEGVRYSWGYKPRSLRAVLQSNTPAVDAETVALLFYQLALCLAGEKRWHEALVLAQFAELPTTLSSTRHAPNPIPPSQLVTAAFRACSDRNIGDCLNDLITLASSSNDEISTVAAYDSCRILLKQRRFHQAEKMMRSTLEKLVEASPTFSVVTSKGFNYVWIIKALSLALLCQGRTVDAHAELLKARSKIQKTVDDDTLSMLHIDMLLGFFHRVWGADIPPPTEDYEGIVAARFKRMYAGDKADLCKAEGLNMAIVLLGQGAHEEAVAVLGLFIEAASAPKMLGKEHKLTLRARRFCEIALEEMEQEKQNEDSGDFWFHFGSPMFPRDARKLDKSEQGPGSLGKTDGVSVSWPTEHSRNAPGVWWDELEAMLVDAGVLPLPPLQVLRRTLLGSRFLQVFSSLVVLVISVALIAFLS